MALRNAVAPEILRAFETVPDLYLILSVDLIILTASEAYLQATLTERKAIVGRLLFEVFPDNPQTPQADGTSNLNASLQQALSTQKPHRMALQRYDVPRPASLGGGFEEKYWSPLNTPVLDAEGQVAYLIHRVEDVTQCVKTETRLKALQQQQIQDQAQIVEQRNLLEALINQAPVGIGFFEGARQLIRWANPLLCAMWGYAPEAVRNRPLLEGVPELQGQGFDTLIGNVLTTGAPYVGKETPAQFLRNGKLETSYYNFVFQPVSDGQGQITGVLDVVTDVSEQVKARQQVQQLNEELAATNEELAVTNEELMSTIEELYVAKEAMAGLNTDLEARVRERTQQVDASHQQMEQANGQLQKINNDLNTFVYTASHDLKSPILNVEGLLTALEKRLEPEIGRNQVVKELFGMLNKQVSRFKATIEDLTDVARIGQESAQDVAGIELGPVLAEVLLGLEKERVEAGAQIDIHVDCPVVQFSRKNLRSIVYNLLSNAIKYRSPERKLRIGVSCQTQGDYHVLTVEDNGLGVNLSQGEKMFTLFKRFHTHVPGTGMGLHIVKKMVENAEGRIQVESQVDLGSTFKVYFKR
jgi:PAS domain S-box-containing protein